MRIELILTTDNKALLKEELLLHKLHNCHIVTIEVKNFNYVITHVKKVLFCGIDHNGNQLYKIRHLPDSQKFNIQDILNYHKNMQFINKIILTSNKKSKWSKIAYENALGINN